MSNRSGNAFLTKRELAQYLGLSVFTIDAWVSQRREIPYIKMGKKVMFDMNDVLEWIANSKIHPKSFG
jgi:excisionase family DNA binding protein